MRNELLNGFLLRDKRVEPLTGTVRANGTATHLPSKSIEVLLYLAKHPRKLVSREELLQQVWGDAGAAHERLSHAVSEIRHALDDHSDHPVFIQTVPKRGYRLLVEPQIPAPEQSQPGNSGDPPEKTLVANLMDRGVIQAGAAFLVVGWLLIQVADAVVPILGLPGWTTILITYVVIGGFPVVVVLAWFFEYAEGRFYLDRGRDSPTVTTGLGKNYLTIVAAYAIAATGGLLYQWSTGFEVPEESVSGSSAIAPEAVVVEPNSIAVLKFLSIDGSDLSNVFAHGVAEDVLDRLARVRGLLVSARGDSWSLPENASSNEVRRRLRVAYYLEGSVRLVGNELRVVAQLIDSETGFHIVSRSFDRKVENFMEVQREITSLTVANLRPALPGIEDPFAGTSYDTGNPDAYVLYKRGTAILDQPRSLATIDEARRLFEQALALDSEYAAAHAGLCQVGVHRYYISNDASDIRTAEQACANALAANPNLYMVHTALGTLYVQTGQFEAAERAFSSALTTNPQDVSAIRGLADVALRDQETATFEQLINEAISLQPGNWRTINSLGNFYFNSGRYSDAAEEYRKVVFLDPANWVTLANQGAALMMAGDFREALESLESAIAIERNQTTLSNIGVIYYYLGQFDQSVLIHEQAVAISPNSPLTRLNLADSLHFAGEQARADKSFDEAARLADQSLLVNATDSEVVMVKAWAKAMRGELQEARELVVRGLELAPDDPYVHYYNALLSVRENNNEAAVRSIRTAIEMGYPKELLAAEPYLRDLRDDEQFIELLEGNR